MAERSRVASAGRALGLRAGEKLVVKDVITDADGSVNVRYNRTFDGLRVIGGDLVSHRDRSGKLTGVDFNGSHQVTVASTKPKVSLASARANGSQKAMREQETTAATKGELVVYSGGASAKSAPKLAYDVLTMGVRADQTPSRLHTVVDAKTGGTLASWDEIENGSGNGLYVGAVSIGTTAGPPFTMRDSDSNYTTDLNGSTSTSATGTTFTDADDSWGNGAVSDRASAGVAAHYGAEKTFDFYESVLGRNGIWNTGVGARSRVHFGDGYANAFWDGAQLTYGDGAGNARPLVEVDIAAHEMTHGVTENTAGLVGDGEAGGLNEATSDIFGTSVEWYANNAADTPDYLIGELVDINGDGTPLRYQDRPSRDGVSADCWSSTVGNLDSHYSAGPLNHWFYLASEGSGAKVINGVSYNSPTCNASTVTPMGRDKAAKIWYRTLTTYLTSGSSYTAAREGAIQSAKDLYGATSAECTSIAASFSAIAVPAGAATCGITTPPPVGSNLLSNPGFESGTTAWSATSNVVAQWGVDQPARSGTWSAWLGGYGSAHTDSISQLVTIPASSSATLLYYLHIDTNEAPGTSVFDTFTVRAGSTALQTMSNLNAASGYQLRTVDLSAYVGRTISLSFTGAEDSSAATSFVVDDASVTTPSTVSVPGAPTAVTATPGNAQAGVSWTAPASSGSSAITGYTVTSSPGGLTATTSGATTTTFPGLTNGTAYSFTVKATNAAGTSAASSASTAVTPRTVPGAPTAVSATAGNMQAAVSWTAPVNNGGSAVTGYTVTSSPGGLTATTTGATTATVDGLANGTAYTFTVTAANAAGSSVTSSASAAVTPRTLPAAPTAVSATAGNAEAVVSWTASDSNGGSPITGYTVTSTPGGQTATTSGATTATVTGLTNGTAYTFRVTAASASGASASSLPSAAVTPRTVPGAPTTVSAAPGSAQAAVSWAAPGSDGGSVITGYTVTSSPGGLTATTSGATTATVAGLTNGTTYTFTVTATNAAGTSAASSASVAVSPGAVPGAPTAVSATPGNAQATVSWTAPPSNGGGPISGYTVTSSPGGLTATTSGATTATVTGLTNGTAYTFTVTAANASGVSTSSTASIAVTPTVTAAVTRLSDFNADGFTDLVARDGNGNLWLYRGTGAGTLMSRLKIGTGWNVMTALVTPGDVTGDGNADVIARDAAGLLWLYPGTGASRLSARRQIGSGWASYTITGGADLNRTGRPDLLARDSAGALWMYPLSGNGVIGTRTLVSTGWSGYTIQGPGDLNGDGTADILARDSAGSLWVYRGNGAGSYFERTLVSAGWAEMTALVTPGNWDRAAGNDLLTRDAAGALWFYPGNDAGGLGPKRLLGASGWQVMTYLG